MDIDTSKIMGLAPCFSIVFLAVVYFGHHRNHNIKEMELSRFQIWNMIYSIGKNTEVNGGRQGNRVCRHVLHWT